jgi:muramoyltetrapeptide carboxypeptidase
MHRYAQIPLIHGPVLESLSRIGTEPQAEQNAVKLVRLLQGRDSQPFSEVHLKHICGPRQAQGRLLAGNLSLLSALVGTHYTAKTAGTILCIEEVKESPYRVHRMLLQLKLAGVFEKVRAVIFGSLSTCVHPKGLGPTIENVVVDIFSAAKFPVYFGLPFGHAGDNFSIPLGIKAELSHNHLELLEEPVLN